MPMQEPQVAVSTSTIEARAASGLRYLFSLGLTWLAAKGFVPLESVGEISAQLVAIALAAYGIWKAGRRQSDLIVSARAAPNDIATVTKGLK